MPVKVRCIRILEGGRHDGREIDSSSQVTVGAEYVVLAIWSSPSSGTEFGILGDAPYSDYGYLFPAGMFEIGDPTIPSTWRARQPYPLPSDLVVIGPAAFDTAYDLARDSDDQDQRNWGWDVWAREVRRLYEEAGERPPDW